MTLNKNKKLLLGLSIATIFALGLVSYSSVAYAGGAAPGLVDAADTTDDVSASLVPVGPAFFAQHNFGTKSISLYFGTDTIIQDSPQNNLIGGFIVDAAPTAKFTTIVADSQTLTTNPISFNGAFKGFLTAADGIFWDTFTADASANVAGGDIAATVTVSGSQIDCLTTVGIVFEEGSGQPAGYVAAGVSLRGDVSDTINIAGIPAGHAPVAAYLYWNVMDNQLASNQIDINGNTVTALLVGSDVDPCWPPTQTFGLVADVTAHVPGNGAYIISNLPISGTSFMQGASLVVVHQQLIAAEKTWTHTDYNWDEICEEIPIDGVLQLVCRPANINNPDDDVLADPLDQDAGDKYLAFAQVHNEKFKNTNPGAMYALTTIDVTADLDSLWVDEMYGDCTVAQDLLKFVSKKETRNVKVAVADPNGDVTELTDDLYDGIGGSISADIDNAEVHITDASNLTEGSTVYVLVKFNDDLKGDFVLGNVFDEMCDNVENVTANAGDNVQVEAAAASLRITNQ